MSKKSILTLTLTLLLGFVVGFFISGRMAKKRIRHMYEMTNNPQAEGHHLSKRLKLTEDQLESIQPILDSMLPVHRTLRHAHRKEMDSARNIMFQSILPYLTEDQIEKVEKMKKHRHKGPPHHKRRGTM
jgi:uncharacterized protein YneF (UPF0154 family)